MPISESVLRRLTLSRYFFHLALEHSASHREVSAYATVNLLYDSVEMFLVAAAEHLGVPVDQGTTFDQYLRKIEDSKAPWRVPFRLRLQQLNKVRVQSKHHGILPDSKEIPRFMAIAREFFEESGTAIFGTNFWTVSLADQLQEGEVKTLVMEAENAFQEKDFANCLIKCRQILFIEFEHSYDIKDFYDDPPKRGLLFGPHSYAPYYAKNKKYIDENVKDPFDFIIVDHAHLDAQLLKDGIDPEIYWNIWRLTPSVYRNKKEPWTVEYHVEKLDIDGIEERAAYCLENVVDIALRRDHKRQSVKYQSSKTKYYIRLRREGVNVYTKADKTSPVKETTPPSVQAFCQ